MKAMPCAAACLLALGGSAWAQKYPGQTIPDAPAPRAVPYRPAAPAYRPPPPPPAAPPPAAPPRAGAERDAEARSLAAQLPLDPATANLQSRLPTDVPGTVRQLGLRVPTGTRVDLRNSRPSTPQVIDALQH